MRLNVKPITRRTLIKSIGAGMALTLTGGCASMYSKSKPITKPNIVFVLSDDLGWSDLACYGNQYHETPHIDALAAEGMRFTDAYAASPVCSPTRASIYAGQYPARMGLTDFIPGHWKPYSRLRVPRNHPQHLPLECITIAEVLQTEGYVTGMFGKWHCGDTEDTGPDNQGFDTTVTLEKPHFGPQSREGLALTREDYFADVVTGRSIDFIEENQNRPFCLFVNHLLVHTPLQAHPLLIHKYEKKKAQLNVSNNPVYAAMVEHLDHSVGSISKKLDNLNLKHNTIFIFFSDNGGLVSNKNGKPLNVTSNAPLRGEKGTLYEGGVRVPLIIRWPGHIPASSICNEPVISVDFYPTFLEVANCKTQAGHVLDGVSLTPIWRQGKTLQREAIYWHYPHYHHSTPAGAIRCGPWKLIEFFQTGKVELYHLKQDIQESINRAEQKNAMCEELQERLIQWRTTVCATLPVTNPDHITNREHEWTQHPDKVN